MINVTFENTNKAIKTLTINAFLQSKTTKPEFTDVNAWSKTDSVYYCTTTKAAADAVLGKASTKAITPGKCFFDATSTFPRVNLTDTDFKRTIKKDTGDYIVIGNSTLEAYQKTRNYSQFVHASVYEDDEFVYVIPSIKDTKHFSLKTIEDLKTYLCLGTTDLVDYAIRNNYIPSEAKFIGIMDLCSIATKGERELIDRYTEGFYDNVTVITDAQLTAAVAKGQQAVDEDALDSLNEMLGSPDAQVVEMGLKLLSTYNLSPFPYTVKTLLNLNFERIKDCKSWNGVGIKHMRTSLNYEDPSYVAFPGCILGVRSNAKKANVAEADLNLALKYCDSRWNAFEAQLEDSFNKMLKEKGLI